MENHDTKKDYRREMNERTYYHRHSHDTSLEIICRLLVWSVGLLFSGLVWYGVIGFIRRLF